MAELTQAELDMYAAHTKHLEKSSMYFSEQMIPIKSATQTPTPHKNQLLEKRLDYKPSNRPAGIQKSNMNNNPLYNSSGLNCYLTNGFVRTSKKKIKPLNFFIFAKDSADFFARYDGIAGLVKKKSLQMRILTQEEQHKLEQKIKLEEGYQILQDAKIAGHYIPRSKGLVKEVLIDDFNG